MSTEPFELSEPELTVEDLLVLEDPRFDPGTAAVVTGAASGVNQATAEVANLFVFGFSKHGKHLNGGDLLWDNGYTTTYE